jgi:putative ABC transport system permease protein
MRLRIPRRLVTLKENTAMALETLRGQKTRSGLTMMGVFIGVVIVTAIASVLNGFRDNVIQQVEAFGTSTIFVTRFPIVFHDHSDRAFRSRKNLEEDDAWAIRDHCPSVETVSPVLEAPQWRSSARAGGERMENPFVRGGYPTVEKAWNLAIREGRFFTDVENEHRLDVAVIGSEVEKALFPGRSALEKEIDVSGNRLRVIGVLEKHREGPLGEGNHEDQVIWMPYGAFGKHYPRLDDHFIVVAAKPGKILEAQEEIEEVLRRRRKVRWNEDNNFELMTADSIIETFDDIVFGAVAVMFIMSSVAFMVGGVGVMNIMLASVKERTREIGMRKAIGGRRRDIAWQFLVEAMVLTGTGGIAGMLFIDVLGLAVRQWWAALPIATPLWGRIAGFAGSVSVGLLFGIWPAMKAARMDPIEALRYE